MPWTFDALLPTAERYASLKFRRVAPSFDATRLDYAEAVELVAFVRTVGMTTAARIFHWGIAGRREADRLLKHLSSEQDVALAVDENRAAYTRAEGLRVLEIMKENGWEKGHVPEIVRFALLDMRDAGLSQPKIAELVGLTLDQVRVMANGPRRRSTSVPLSSAGLWAV